MSLRAHLRIIRQAADYDIGNHPCPCGCGMQLKPHQTIHRDTYTRALRAENVVWGSRRRKDGQ